MNLEVVPIHKYPEHLKMCCKLINQEWKRSESARLHSLKQSSDNLPTSLILLNDKTVIGHAKLSKIPSIKSACFIESVVIDSSLRGKGYGSILMKEAEMYSKSIGLDTIYLSTKGQEGFYSKLGYEKCAPISIYGSFFSFNKTQEKNKTDNKEIKLSPVVHAPPSTKSSVVPLPPPPPVPSYQLPPNIKEHNTKIFMKKVLY